MGAVAQTDAPFTKVTTGPVVTDNEDSWGSVWVDYDMDGDVDLFVANGFSLGNQRNALYRNDGGSFTRMTAADAGAIVNEPGSWGQAAWADYDNDGRPDAIVVGYPGTALYHNLGQGMFERRLDLVPASWPLGPGPCFADYDNDGWVDWFVGSAVSGSPIRHNSLFHNERGQAITLPITNGPIVADVLSHTEASTWGDFDADGDLDLLITLGGAGPNVRLYENLGGGSFRRAQTTGLEESLGAGAYPCNAAWADCDNDGRLDLFVSVRGSTYNVLFHNEGSGVFSRRLMGAAGDNCAPAWADYDNDGWQDLILTRGQGSPLAAKLWHNNEDGTFTEITTGSIVTDVGRSQGAAWGDYDNDGFMDLFVARGRVNGQNALYHNNGNSNRWLKVKLEGTTSNRSAIGAKVKVLATINGRSFWQMREVPGGNRCQDDLRANFGLGNATVVNKLRVEWPSGTVQELSNVATNQILTVIEPRRPVLALEATPTGFTGTLHADGEQTYQVQASEDLATGWTVLTNVTTDATGTAYWSDPGLSPQGRRFYKAVKAP